jgi:hypothetical protein
MTMMPRDNVTKPQQLELLRKWREHERWFNSLSEAQQLAIAPHLMAMYREIGPDNDSRLPEGEFERFVEVTCTAIAAAITGRKPMS